MSSSSRLEPGRVAVVIVDLQERFAGAIEGWPQVLERAALLARLARLLDVPVIVTEQYPKGLGPTVEQMADALGDFTALEKSCFSSAGADGFDLDGRDQVVLCGIETHICVLQTALDLLAAGVDVQLAVDATGSRRAGDRATAIDRMTLAGVVPTTVEAVGFELLGTAEAPAFRDFQELIK